MPNVGGNFAAGVQGGNVLYQRRRQNRLAQLMGENPPVGDDYGNMFAAMQAGGFGPEAIALRQQIMAPERDIRKLMLEDQLKRARQKEQFDMFSGFVGGGGSMSPGTVFKYGPQGPQVEFDPAKAQQADIAARELYDKTGAWPAGYGGGAPRTSGSGIPASSAGLSPKDARELAAKRAEEGPQAAKSARSLIGGLDLMDAKIDEIKSHPGYSSATGGTFWTGYVPGTDAKGAAALMNSLKAQVANAAISAMREASKTGGAVGNVTEKEWPRLESMIASLDTAVGTEEFTKQLDHLKEYNKWLREQIKGAHETTYGKLDYKPYTRSQGQQNAPKTGVATHSVGNLVTGPDSRRYVIRSLKADGTPDDVELVK